MKRKKELLKSELDSVFVSKKLVIKKEGNEWFFEIGKEMTNDLSEAVTIMMRVCKPGDSAWDLEINNTNIENITPEKSLFWLTGGTQEWRNLENYNRPWCDCYLDFQEEFGFMIIKIIKDSKKLSEVRDGFIKYLNLPIIYDFAMSKNLLK
jgi:hypothetical protein